MREHRCSICDLPMEFCEADPDVGVLSSGWYCHNCDHGELADDDDEPEPPR